MFQELRHKVELTIFIILVFIAFVSPYWIAFTFLASVAFIFLLVGKNLILIIIDLMFLDESVFIYDPDYNHWKDMNEPKDFQFEADLSSVKDQKKRF